MRIWKSMEHESDDTSCNQSPLNNNQKMGTATG